MASNRRVVELAYFPCGEDKAPLPGSSPLTTRVPAEKCKPLVGLYAGQHNLLCLDFEVHEVYDEWLAIVTTHGIEFDGATVATRGGGVHVWIRCAGGAPEGEKLAAAATFPDKSLPHNGLLVETRGSNNQYAIVPPSPGWEYLPFSPEIAAIEETDDWQSLLAAARMLDERPIVIESSSTKKSKDGTRPGDDYKVSGESFADLLTRNGWTELRRTSKGGRTCWVRPGKSKGISGTLTADGEIFTCFTSSTPLQQGKHYSKFGALVALEFAGDFSAAAKQLASNGFGERGTFTVVPESIAELPVIETNGESLVAMSDAAIVALHRFNGESQKVFVRSGSLCRIVKDDKGRPAMQFLDGPALRGILARSARWVSTSSKRGAVDVLPPVAVCEDIASLGTYAGFPSLEGIAPAPVLGNGAIRLEDGYCEKSGFYVASGRSWKVAEKSAAEAAEWLLTEVLSDFPFQSDADKANALALMILPFVRPIISGPTPLHLVDAPTMGTGKTMLVKTCLLPFLGEEAPATTAPTDEEEWRKKIMTALIAGWPAMFIDNISRRVDSDAFAMALTSSTWTDRILGSAKSVALTVRMIWAGTANNAQLSVDLARRSVWIRLDAQLEKPWQREDFRHADLHGWMIENRREIVANILAIVQEWVAKKMPVWSGKPLGSYESYCRIVGGILDCAKVPQYLANWETMFESTNNDESSWRSLYSRWWDQHGDNEVRTSDVYELLKDDDSLMNLLGDRSERGQVTRLGYILGRRIKRVCDGRLIVKVHSSQRGARFKLMNLCEPYTPSNPSTREYQGHSMMDTKRGEWEKVDEGSYVPTEWPRIEKDEFGTWSIDENGHATRLEAEEE